MSYCAIKYTIKSFKKLNCIRAEMFSGIASAGKHKVLSSIPGTRKNKNKKRN